MLETQFSHTFMSEQPKVSQAVKGAVSWLRERGVEEGAAASIEIAMAEALNNVVEHGYAFCENGQIDISLDLVDAVLRLAIRDQGKKFPGIPQKKEMHGDAVAFENLPEGGFGWFLIHSLTRRIDYAFLDDKNVLFLEFDAPQ